MLSALELVFVSRGAKVSQPARAKVVEALSQVLASATGEVRALRVPLWVAVRVPLTLVCGCRRAVCLLPRLWARHAGSWSRRSSPRR